MTYNEISKRYHCSLTGRFVSFKAARIEQATHEAFYLDLMQQVDILITVNAYRVLYHVGMIEAYRAVTAGNKCTRS